MNHFPKSEILVMRREFSWASGRMGMVRGFLPHRWPTWFAPEPVGAFPASLPVTRAGDVRIVPTEGHTEAHVSVVLNDADCTYFFAGDTSYTQQLMLDQQVEGVSPNERAARQTLRRIRQFAALSRF